MYNLNFRNNKNCFYYTPRSTKLKGVYWFHFVRLSVRPSARLSDCGQNGVRSVSSTIVARSISYLHIYQPTSEDVSRLLCKSSKIWIFGNFLTFAHLALSCVHVMWMVKVDSSPEFYCSHFEWPKIADISRPPWELIRFWSSAVDFPHFGAILT